MKNRNLTEEELDAVEAPWGWVCEMLLDLPAGRDTIYKTTNYEEYLSISPATLADWWASWQFYRNEHPDFWISEGPEECRGAPTWLQ